MPRTPKSFTKESISRIVAKEHDLSLTQAREVINTAIDSMISTLEDGETVKLSGLATFHIEPRGPRKHRNPRTGEYFEAPAKNVIRVNTSKILDEKVAQIPVNEDELD